MLYTGIPYLTAKLRCYAGHGRPRHLWRIKGEYYIVDGHWEVKP